MYYDLTEYPTLGVKRNYTPERKIDSGMVELYKYGYEQGIISKGEFRKFLGLSK